MRLSAEMMETRSQCNNIFKAEEENYNPQILYQQKYPSNIKVK